VEQGGKLNRVLLHSAGILNAVIVPFRSEVRIPDRQTFEIDRKLDIFIIILVYIMIKEGEIKSALQHLCLFNVIDFSYIKILQRELGTAVGRQNATDSRQTTGSALRDFDTGSERAGIVCWLEI
jgi:hypothetical protein